MMLPKGLLGIHDTTYRRPLRLLVEMGGLHDSVGCPWMGLGVPGWVQVMYCICTCVLHVEFDSSNIHSSGFLGTRISLLMMFLLQRFQSKTVILRSVLLVL